MVSIEQICSSVAEVSREYPIKKVELFGSYANGTSTQVSDVDLLVEFITGSVSLLMLSGLKYRLQELLKVDVDVIHAPVPADSLIIIDKVVPIYES